MTSALRPPAGRIQKLFEEITTHLDLNLTQLTVYTEAASGPYLHTPLLAAFAGADVVALARDSAYAPADRVEQATLESASELGLDVRVVREKRQKDVSAADIITNAALIRPIDAEMISWMKSTAVVPLMWETWEFREQDLDLDACRRKGILVLGTVESRPPVDMRPYAGFLAMRLLFDLGLEGQGTKVAVLGGQATLGVPMVTHLRAVGCEVGWFTSGGSRTAGRYEDLAPHWQQEGATYDALLVAEHEDGRSLLGPEGLLTPELLSRVSPWIRIGIISGNVDEEALRSTGLDYLPRPLRPFGYMSYQVHELGPRPVLELYGGGLKVGEVMARSRLRGESPREAAAFAVANSPAMDFTGENAWI